MHVIPQLRKLERKYYPNFVVIGVHSAKFPGEQPTEAVREASLRHGLGHPIVNDRDFLVWRQYGVRAWPTLIFIDPAGRPIGKHEGEFTYEQFDELIGAMLAEFRASKALDDRPLDWLTPAELASDTGLAFPGKVTMDSTGDRLFITDTNHHRLLVSRPDGVVEQVIGSGVAGFADGDLATATFNQPQGVAFDANRDWLYIADTENHALRVADLRRGGVATLAGNGDQARLWGATGGLGPQTGLNSPWDLALANGDLYIAMAGSHQVWRYDPRSARVEPYAGNAREGLEDGPVADAWLAQPSGIAFDGAALYIADSEVSGIRRIDLPGPGASVTTVIGRGLFEFGDIDGVGDAVRLQHPLGLAWDAARRCFWLADTYNHKIKRLDPATRAVTTAFGSGEPGYRDGVANEALFREPNDVAVIGDALYVADTNNHRLRRIDLASGRVSTLDLQFNA